MTAALQTPSLRLRPLHAEDLRRFGRCSTNRRCGAICWTTGSPASDWMDQQIRLSQARFANHSLGLFRADRATAAFDRLKWSELRASVDAANLRSIALLERLGFAPIADTADGRRRYVLVDAKPGETKKGGPCGPPLIVCTPSLRLRA